MKDTLALTLITFGPLFSWFALIAFNNHLDNKLAIATAKYKNKPSKP
jgi:hypothetical protein